MNNALILTLLAAIAGAGANMSIIGAQALFVSRFGASQLVSFFVVAGILLSLVLGFYKRIHRRYIWWGNITIAVSLLGLAGTFFIPPEHSLFAVSWLAFGFFFAESSKWFVMELASRYMNPAAANKFQSSFVVAYEIGTLFVVGAITLKLIHSQYFLMAGSVVGAAIILLVSILQFGSRRNLELHNLQPRSASGKMAGVAGILWLFTGLVLCWGLFKFQQDLAVKTFIKAELQDYGPIKQTISLIYLVSSVLAIAGNLAVGRAMEKFRISPALLTGIGLTANFVFAGICLIHTSMTSVVLLGAMARAMERFAFLPALQVIVNSSGVAMRAVLRARQQMAYLGFSGLAVIAVGAVVAQLDTALAVSVYLGLAVASMVAGFAVLAFFTPRFVRHLYHVMQSGDRVNSVMAINALSFFKPQDFTSRMKDMLQSDIKRMIRKNVIISLGFSKQRHAIELIRDQFDSEKEEVQIAVVEALKATNDYEATQFIVNVLLSQVNAITRRVRLNAAQVVAMIYGKKAIPLILNGLEVDNPRTVANTLEALSFFKDRSLGHVFERFLNSKVPRIKANALIGLAQFRHSREQAYRELIAMVQGRDSGNVAAALYAIGVARLKAALPEVYALLDSRMGSSVMIRRCIAYALTQLNEERGEQLFAELIVTTMDPIHKRDLLNLFSQLDKSTRFDVIQSVCQVYRDQPAFLHMALSVISDKEFDFYEELVFLHCLTHYEYIDYQPLDFGAETEACENSSLAQKVV